MAPYLYDGTAGIALFLAALANVTGEPEWRARSLLVLAPIRSKFGGLALDPERAARLDKVGIGGFLGLGSILYTFVLAARLLEEPEMLDEALVLSRIFTSARIAGDPYRDVLLGSAGAVLALLALERAVGDGPESAGLLAIASECGRHLVAGRSISETGDGVWRTLPGFPPLTGFSHGAAGLASALLRLYGSTGDPRLRTAADECLAFERGAYCAERRNWRDPRHPERLQLMVSWCYGAPGIALGRLSTLTVLDDPRVREEIEIGLETTRSAPLVELDHLCCGNLGRAEVLLQAGTLLGSAGLTEAAERLAREVRQHAGIQGAYRWRLEDEPGFFDPSFFTGAAGIGYTFLRLLEPRRLPCILALE